MNVSSSKLPMPLNTSALYFGASRRYSSISFAASIHFLLVFFPFWASIIFPSYLDQIPTLSVKFIMLFQYDWYVMHRKETELRTEARVAFSLGVVFFGNAGRMQQYNI